MNVKDAKMNDRIEELPLMNAVGNGGGPPMNGNGHAVNGHHRHRFASSINVPPELQLTLSWQNVVVNHHPSASLIGRIRGEPAPETKQILKGGKVY